MGWRKTGFCLQTSLIIYFEVHYLLLNFTKTENPGLKRFLNIAVVLVCLAACIFSVRTIVRALWTGHNSRCTAITSSGNRALN